jgi:hypothetical protein
VNATATVEIAAEAISDPFSDKSSFQRSLARQLQSALRPSLRREAVKRCARLTAISLALVTISAASHSQGGAATDRSGDFASAFKLARAELLQGNYLTAIGLVRPFALKEIPAEPPTIRDANAFQVWDQMQAMVSGEPSGLKPDPTDLPDQQTIKVVAEAASKDALSAIADRARSTRVVILNENHDTPCQRAFAARVAETLRPLGYDTLALEALATFPASTAAELRERGYPTYGDGFYTKDPVFAAFIRRSLQLGYSPLAYEYNAEQGSGLDGGISRERGQAENLTRFLLDHPRTKLFVYSGGGHLAEQPLADGSKMMGQFLRELSGIDPLTIDQNRLQPGTAARRLLIRQPVSSDRMLFVGDAPLVVGNLAGKVDMQVLAATPKYVAGRSSCLMSADRRRLQIRIPKSAMGRDMLLQAVGRTDGPAAIPLDQLAIGPGMSSVSLFLPNTPIRFIWKN